MPPKQRYHGAKDHTIRLEEWPSHVDADRELAPNQALATVPPISCLPADWVLGYTAAPVSPPPRHRSPSSDCPIYPTLTAFGAETAGQMRKTFEQEAIQI